MYGTQEQNVWQLNLISSISPKNPGSRIHQLLTLETSTSYLEYRKSHIRPYKYTYTLMISKRCL